MMWTDVLGHQTNLACRAKDLNTTTDPSPVAVVLLVSIIRHQPFGTLSEYTPRFGRADVLLFDGLLAQFYRRVTSRRPIWIHLRTRQENNLALYNLKPRATNFNTREKRCICHH